MKRAKGTNRRGQEPRDKRESIASFRRAELKILFGRRRESSPIDRNTERAWLLLLLELGLSGPDALQWAPWLSPTALQELFDIADANGTYWAGCDDTHTVADKIGERVELTWPEFLALGPFKYIAPYDVDRHVVRKFWHDRELERERIRRRNERAQEAQTMDNLSQRRDRAVRAALTGSWEVKSVIDGRVAPSFGLSEAALRRAVTRIINKLVKHGFAEKKIVPGTNGMPTCLVRRRSEMRPAILADEAGRSPVTA